MVIRRKDIGWGGGGTRGQSVGIHAFRVRDRGGADWAPLSLRRASVRKGWEVRDGARHSVRPFGSTRRRRHLHLKLEFFPSPERASRLPSPLPWPHSRASPADSSFVAAALGDERSRFGKGNGVGRLLTAVMPDPADCRESWWSATQGNRSSFTALFVGDL